MTRVYLSTPGSQAQAQALQGRNVLISRRECDRLEHGSAGMTLALTDKQVEDLSNAIASVVVCNLPGTGHLRDQIAAWAEDCLAGTKFEGWSTDQLAPDTGTVEVEALVRVDKQPDGRCTWSICGWHGVDDHTLRDDIDQRTPADEWTETPRWSRIRARVPIPQDEVTVGAEVEEAGS